MDNMAFFPMVLIQREFIDQIYMVGTSNQLDPDMAVDLNSFTVISFLAMQNTILLSQKSSLPNMLTHIWVNYSNSLT